MRGFLEEEALDAFLFTDLPDLRWCCGFSGSSGALIVDRTRAVLFTDRRYRDQAETEVVGAMVSIYEDAPFLHIAESGVLAGATRLGIDPTRVVVAMVDDLEAAVPGLESIMYRAPFDRQISRKDPAELDAMRRAQSITDRVFEEILGLLKPGLTELEVAAEIVYRHMKAGASGVSFPPIVASGPNGAFPHAQPSNRTLRSGDLVILDLGCFVDGYASDMTRTVAIGRPEVRLEKAYDVVLSAQRRAQDAAHAGMRASELDRIGRGVVEDAGYGDAFNHSLGHGLGLRVHEWPRIARTNEEILPENAVVTIEPGIYIAGAFGIRIENAVLLTSSGSEPLPTSDTSLIVI